ncbi:MAG: MotA/TolQ/ExbB proton channel family protein [Gammaproteobacteria bacterium]
MKQLIKSIPLFVALAALPLVAVTAQAAPAASQSKPNTLQQLLDQVQADLQHQTAQDRARLQKFEQAHDKQKALLDQANNELAQQKARTKALQSQFDANEKSLAALTTTLTTREGNLGEVFGTVRQTAGQFKSSLDTSLISAQYPNRGLFAAKLAASKALPSIQDLKKLWYDMLQEMVEQGQVVKYKTDVTLNNGSKKHTDVVRIGAFNTVMGDTYLQFEPTAQALVVIPKQPPGRYTDSVGTLYHASGNHFVGAGVDATRGQLLNKLILEPSFQGRLNEGGPVGYTILVLFAIALLFCLERGITLGITSSKMKAQLKSDTPNPNNPLGRVLAVYDQNRKDDVETLTLKLDEAIMKEVPAIETRQSFIKLIAAIGPLLGLLGTVVGMIETFTAITLFGTGNPAYMANGISTALVTTVEGLVTAIPLVFLHGLIQGKSQRLVHILEEQTAGILAAQAEKANR